MTVPKQFVLYRDSRGEWRWTLYAENARKVADSAEGYINRSDAIHAIRLVAALAAEAQVWDPQNGQWI